MAKDDTYSLGYFRFRKDATQQELADVTGYSRSYIASVESRQDLPSKRLLKIVSQALGLDEEESSKLFGYYYK